MYFFIGIPIFTGKKRQIKPRIKAIEKWFNENEKDLEKRYKSIFDTLILAPDRVLECIVDKVNKVKINFPFSVTKGLAVRLHILTILNWIDSKDLSRRNDSYYLLIDGSGAFDFSSIFQVLDKLCETPKLDIVLGNRPPEESGMEKWRKDIELFEEYLIYNKFGIPLIKELTDFDKLPDSQAGCWGLRVDAIKHISLTARDYELEYDLLVSSIEAKKKIGFTEPLKMNETPRHTDYGRDLDSNSLKKCISKMEFIIHRLDLKPKDIPYILEKYTHDFPDRKLEDMYIEAIMNNYRTPYS